MPDPFAAVRVTPDPFAAVRAKTDNPTHIGPAPPTDWINVGADLLPAVGGAIGGGVSMAGSPLLVPVGAALGGMMGRSARNLIRVLRNPKDKTVPGTVSGVALDQAQTGLEQGSYEAGGQLASRALGNAATQIMRRSLRPSLSERLAPRAAQTVKTTLEEGINPFSASSVAKIEPRIAQLGADVSQVVRTPDPVTGQPVMINPKQIAQSTRRVARGFAGAGADPADRAAAKGVVTNFLKDVSTPVSVPGPLKPHPQGLLDASGQPIMQPTTVTMRQIQPMTGTELHEARMATGKSAGQQSFGITRGAETEARKELYHNQGSALTTHFPETGPLMQRQSRLIDVKQAANKAYERSQNEPLTSLRRLLPFGGGMLTYGSSNDMGRAARNALFIQLATDPRMAGRAALMLAMASRHPEVLANVLRATGTGVHQLVDER